MCGRDQNNANVEGNGHNSETRNLISLTRMQMNVRFGVAQRSVRQFELACTQSLANVSDNVLTFLFCFALEEGGGTMLICFPSQWRPAFASSNGCVGATRGQVRLGASCVPPQFEAGPGHASGRSWCIWVRMARLRRLPRRPYSCRSGNARLTTGTVAKNSLLTGRTSASPTTRATAAASS